MKTLFYILLIFLTASCSTSYILEGPKTFNNLSIIPEADIESYQVKFPIETGAEILLYEPADYNPIFNSANTANAYTGYYYQIYNGHIYFGFGNNTNKSPYGRYSFTSDFQFDAHEWYKIDLRIISATEAELSINGEKQTVRHSSGTAETMVYPIPPVHGSIGHYSGNETYFKGIIKKLYVR